MCVVIISIRPEVNRWQIIAVQSRLVLDPRWMGERKVNWTCDPQGGTWAAWAALACKIIKKKWSKLHLHMWWPKSSSTAAAALDEWSRSWSWPSATIWALLLLARWLVGWSAETCHWVCANRCQHALYVAHCAHCRNILDISFCCLVYKKGYYSPRCKYVTYCFMI